MHVLLSIGLVLLLVFVGLLLLTLIISGVYCVVSHLLMRHGKRVWGALTIVVALVLWAATAYDFDFAIVTIATLMPFMVVGMLCVEHHYDESGNPIPEHS